MVVFCIIVNKKSDEYFNCAVTIKKHIGYNWNAFR